MKKLLPIIFALVGLGLGGGAGYVLRPAPEPPAEAGSAEAGHEEKADKDIPADIDPEGRSYVKINNQFVIPVVEKTRVKSLVVLSISLETGDSDTEVLYNHEPKFRDAFLDVLFDFAYAGGFGGDFTSSANLDTLRMELLLAAQQVLPKRVTDVLITDIVRQDS